jgi:4-diphosphocytidyl-2-C-methyl-D-erythritol kinase
VNGKQPVSLAVLAEPARAKINLSLRVLGRRADGYHSLESLLCFAATGDRLELRLGEPLGLSVGGPMASEAGPPDDNLVLRAAGALKRRIPKLDLGRFELTKLLPVGAGLGGGSADAAAALRLLAQANRLRPDDERLYEAAREVGSDVPACIASASRWMSGTGHELSPPVEVPHVFLVLAYPGVPLATRDVYGALGAWTVLDEPRSVPPRVPRERKEFLQFLAGLANDLEPPAFGLAPIVKDVLEAMRDQPGCALARMSGSGSACFGIFATRGAAALAARLIAVRNPGWWVRNTETGGGSDA